MVELAEIFRLYGAQYREQFGDRMPPSHLRAMEDIAGCRTAALGGQVYFCPKCDEQRYSYHSCKSRHCPKCQNDQANEWLEKQRDLLLPVTHFFVTFTLPAELRRLARSNQRTVYDILFRAAASSLQRLALDPSFIGGRIGMVGVLQTWTRALIYHPHIHFIVPGGGLTEDGTWRSSRPDFLIPVEALSVIFRAKFRDRLKQTGLFSAVDQQVWRKPWVVHCEPVGTGLAACKYLAPDVFRVALSNNRILSLEDGAVTFSYTESATQENKVCTLAAAELIRRFLQHVLPPGFVKVRYYGLMSPSSRHLLAEARLLPGARGAPARKEQSARRRPTAALRCPHCGERLTPVGTLKPRGRSP